MGQQTIMLIAFGIMLVVAGIVFLVNKKRPAMPTGTTSANKSTNETNKQENQPLKQVKRVAKPVEHRDMSEFMKFDKIANDMIYQNKGERYTMVIECKGVNYHLMSEIEQMAVEEGFIMFLNTLKFPIQLYVQTKSIDLSENVKSYKEKVRMFADKQNEVIAKYNELEDDVDSTQEEIDYMKKEKVKYTNIAEYVYDITRYVERMALNKHMLQRSFYIIFSYNKSELATTEKFTQEEYEDLCYRELYTRAQAILGSLRTCSVTGRVLTSNELAQLVYTSLNKDDANIMSIKDALDAGMFRLYTSSEDVIMKRREMLDEAIEEEGRKRVEEVVRQAMEKGLIVSQAESEEASQKEIDKRAIRIIEKSNVDENIKQELKNTIRENRRKRVEKLNELIAENTETADESENIVENVETNEEIADEPANESQEEVIADEIIKDDIIQDDVIQDDELILDTKEGEKSDE